MIHHHQPVNDQAQSPVAVIASDTHLVEKIWSGRNLTEDAYYSFRQVIEYAKHFSVPLILAGDITHRRIIDSRTLQELSVVKSLPEKCYIIQGQHDLQPIPYLKVIAPEKVVWLEEETQPIRLANDWRIFGFDWKPASHLPDRIAAVPVGTSLLVLHQVFEKFMGSVTHPELPISLVPDFISLLVIGDYHHYFYGSLHDDGNLPMVLSPGGTVLTSLGDKLKKGCFLLSGTPQSFDMRFLALKTRPVFVSTLTDMDAVNDFRNRKDEIIQKLIEAPKKLDLPPALQTPIVYLKYPLNLRSELQEMVGLLEKISYVVIKEFIDDTKISNQSDNDAEILNLLSSSTKLDVTIFLKQFVKDSETDLLAVCKELLNEHNTIESVRESYLQRLAKRETTDSSHPGNTDV